MEDIFKKGVSNFWFDNLQEFNSWCHHEMKKLRPKGICGQDVNTVSGYNAFCRKFPTFEIAYKAFMCDTEDFLRGETE